MTYKKQHRELLERLAERERVPVEEIERRILERELDRLCELDLKVVKFGKQV